MSAVTLNRITLVLAVIGLFVAGVLSVSHLMNFAPLCLNNGCEKVATHPSSYWFHIPVAYFGFGAYLTLAALAVVRGVKGLAATKQLSMLGFVISAIGMLVSIFLTYYALTVIKATCIWCMASLGTMFLSFLFHAALAQKEPEDTPGSSLDIKLGAALVVIAVLGIAGEGNAMKHQGIPIIKTYMTAKVFRFVPEDAHIMGNKDAPITVVEFGDLLCPGCKAHFPDMSNLANQSNGKIRFVFRHYPMIMIREHRMSYQAAVLSEVASDEGKFWPYVTQVYQIPDGDVGDASPFTEILKNLQIDPDKSLARSTNIEDPAFKRVYKDMEDGKYLGVTGTPTFFILANGVPPEAAGFNELEAKLDAEPYKSILANGATK